MATFETRDVVECFGAMGVVVANHGEHGNGRTVLEVLSIDGATMMPFADECQLIRAYRPRFV